MRAWIFCIGLLVVLLCPSALPSARASEKNKTQLLGAGLGEACSLPGDCSSGFCVDGVCCDNDCGGSDPDDCQVCAKALSAAADGLCTFLSSGTECRASGGDCDMAEFCDGLQGECPADALKPAGVECRAGAGVCDIAESCDGLSAVCPINALAFAGTQCRAAASECDAIDTCDGIHLECTADLSLEDGAPCGGGLCKSGVCTPASNGAGGNGASSSGSASGGADNGDDAGCGCRIRGGGPSRHWSGMGSISVGFVFIVFFLMRAARRFN